MLWASAGAVALAFLIVLELTARRHGLRGPLSTQAREFVLAPKSGALLYTSLAMTMTVLTWRQRFLAAGVAVGIDLVFFAVRFSLDPGPLGPRLMPGNGALWVLVGCGVLALTRRTGPERILLLKGVGLGLLLVAARKTGDTWLLITSKTRPMVLDQYVATADHALGDPSWLAGRLLRATGPVGSTVLDVVYGQLAVAAVLVSLYQLRRVAAERSFPTHYLVRTFLVIGLLGPGIYMIYPVVGPVYAYGPDGGAWALADLWPNTPPVPGTPLPMPFDGITPRNCMPSLHTAWALAIFIHTRKGPRALRFFGTFWLVATLGATLGFGYHYGADIIAGVVFTLTIEAGLRAAARGWDRRAGLLVAHGTAVFAALLLAYRFLPVEMAARPWLFGPLMLLATGSVIAGYVLVTRAWDREAAAGAGRVPGPRDGSGADQVLAMSTKRE
ncbi:phosphatase PAP2 family protein [Streptomyces sp. NPDC097619]|uniref:phosphatase PAP2 family protein n=1 Tax=Streptomyces sp. NPDC097619 TaxID=3157228 RepID=UPI003324B64B